MAERLSATFAALADPRRLSRGREWLGSNGFTTTTRSYDAPGGIWRFVMHGADGRDYGNRITFDEVVKPERIVYHHGADKRLAETLTRLRDHVATLA